MEFFKFLKNLFSSKKEDSFAKDAQPLVEKPQVEQITERLRDVSSKPLMKVVSVDEEPKKPKKTVKEPKSEPEVSTSVKEIKAKSTTAKKEKEESKSKPAAKKSGKKS